MKRAQHYSHRLFIVLFLLFIVAASVEIVLIARNHNPNSAEKAFYNQADVYFDHFYLPSDPALATSLGVHTYDDQLENFSGSAIKQRISELHQFEKIFSDINPNHLNMQARGDLDLILNNIRSKLLTMETIKSWEKNPDLYSGSLTNSAYVIISRKFAPDETRLRALIAREKQMPSMLQQARENLKNPPKIYTQIALEQLPGIIAFFKNDVPEAFPNISDKTLAQEFDNANNGVILALKNYETWLNHYLLPHSHGDFRLGKATYRKKLLYDEMVDTPLDKLLAINAVNMRQNQRDFVKVAQLINPNKSADEVYAELHTQHPVPNQLLKTFGSEFDDLIRFINDKKIITVPSEVRPIMEETPPFMRAITFASMDTPGPFEKVADEAYFNVTLPDAKWTSTQIKEFMAAFNYAAISSIAVHETYPGHYVQFLWMHNVHDRVRKILGAATNAEGWAHYCEQMVLDEGFGKNGYGGNSDLDAEKLRLGQLQEALLRNARFVVGIQLHTGHMSFDQAIDYFVKEGKQSRQVGVMETKRATSDPTYLYYTLGKLQILALRAEMEAKLGAKFDLKTFHNNFMRQGYPPIKIVREAMLANA